MATSKSTGAIVLAFVIVAALYTAWTAMASSACVSKGIEYQTRTTFSAAEGCTVADNYRAPDWMFRKHAENR